MVVLSVVYAIPIRNGGSVDWPFSTVFFSLIPKRGEINTETAVSVGGFIGVLLHS